MKRKWQEGGLGVKVNGRSVEILGEEGGKEGRKEGKEGRKRVIGLLISCSNNARIIYTNGL